MAYGLGPSFPSGDHLEADLEELAGGEYPGGGRKQLAILDADVLFVDALERREVRVQRTHFHRMETACRQPPPPEHVHRGVMSVGRVVIPLQPVEQFEGLAGRGITRRSKSRKKALLFVSRMLRRCGCKVG